MMNPGGAAITTAVGLVLVLLGIGCGVWAYVETVRTHDTLPIWPWAGRQIQRLKEWRPGSRDNRSGTATAALAITAYGVGSASRVGSPTLETSDESLDAKITRLTKRIEQAEQAAASERERAAGAERDLSERLDETAQHVKEAEDQLSQLTRAVAVSGARLQLVGLLLVGVGTALMAVPTLLAALA